MGTLVNGKWTQKSLAQLRAEGKDIQVDPGFRNWITPDGSAGPTGKGGFKAEKGRYHLYVSYGCPWASRALLMRGLKGLQDYISLSVVDPVLGADGWQFSDFPGTIADPIFGARSLPEVYTKAKADYTGIASVPVLFDKQTGQIVNNESADIMRMLESAFDELTGDHTAYYPKALRAQIDELNVYCDSFYTKVNATKDAKTQVEYEKAVAQVFTMLDDLEQRLKGQAYLLGDAPVETDWKLFTFLVRFDIVFYGLYKCNLKLLSAYPNLWRYVRQLYNTPGVAETVNFEHIKVHHYRGQLDLNPSGIVPIGPKEDWNL
ncbi:glutathione S-transferase family protein [Ligilactobacillus murinus]|nr:glutathione S-transferase C-terminal domain-containing protein [Ligilactobacillus murinus]